MHFWKFLHPYIKTMKSIPLFKELILIFILTIIHCHPILACSCSRIVPFDKSAKFSEVVMRGKVLRHDSVKSRFQDLYEPIAYIEVIKAFRGTNVSDTIRVRESIGYECFGAKFTDGEEYYITGQMKSLVYVDQNYNHTFSGLILHPTGCAESTLRVSDNSVRGQITIYPTQFNTWLYKLLGKIKKVRGRYVQVISIDKLEKKLRRWTK